MPNFLNNCLFLFVVLLDLTLTVPPVLKSTRLIEVPPPEPWSLPKVSFGFTVVMGCCLRYFQDCLRPTGKKHPLLNLKSRTDRSPSTFERDRKSKILRQGWSSPSEGRRGRYYREFKSRTSLSSVVVRYIYSSMCTVRTVFLIL